MSRFLPRRLIAFIRDEEGVTAVECALMLALVVVICLVALTPGSTSNPAPSVRLENG
jgi:Flp pilus assembly pilin Flp